MTTDSDPIVRATAAAASDTQGFGDFFLSRFLDLDISYDDTEKTCAVRLPYAAHLENPQGSGVHGGVIATVVDISMGHLAQRFLSASMTIDMTVRYFRPLTTDGTATGRLLKGGRRLVHLESHVTDADGRAVAHAVGTWHRLDALGTTST